MYQLPVNNLARIRRARKQVKKSLGDIGLELCKEAVEDFKDFCPDEQFVQGTLCLDLCAWDPSYSKTQVYRSKPFCCTECSFSSKYYSGYKNHFRNVHRKIFDRILLNCPYCTFTASRKTMEIHIRIFHQSRLPQPSTANALGTHQYATSQQTGIRQKDSFLGRGRQTDGVEKPVYYCKKCTFRDSLYNVVRRHIYREHFQHVVSPYLAMAPNQSVKNGVSNTILCKRCQFTTRSYEALVQHVVEYHERIGAQVTAMVGHANMMVSKPQASPLTSQRVPVITNRASSISGDPGVQPVIGYLKPNVSKTYSSGAPIKARTLQSKGSLAENNVPLVNTAQTQKWKICTVCNELFPENLYSAHFESAHKAKKVWALAKYIMKIHNFTSKCLLCNRYLPSDTLLNHVLIHGLTCPQCHSAFHSVEKLIEHGTVAHSTPFDGPPGASPLTFDLALKQDKSSNVQLLVLTFNTNESVNGQDDTLLNSLGLAKTPTSNMFENKGQQLTKNALPSMSKKLEMGKTLCPLCFTILKGPISDALSLHLRQRHQVLQTMHPVEKKLTYKCIHCLGVYTSNMVASTITLHLVQCRAVGRSQAALALKAPLNLGTSGSGSLKRQLPMQGSSNPKRMNLGKELATSGSQEEGVDLVLDPSSFEHKTYEARKEFLTAYFNRRPYVSAQEKEKLSAKLWLWKADIASHFAVKQKTCEKHCKTSRLSVLLGFDMNALNKVKHDLIFENRTPETTTTVQKGFKSRPPNPGQSSCTLKPGACMETISIDSDSEPEMDNKPTEQGSFEPDDTLVEMSQMEYNQPDSADSMETEHETQNETNLYGQEITDGVEKLPDEKSLSSTGTQSETVLFKQENTAEYACVTATTVGQESTNTVAQNEAQNTDTC
ncbi:activity-dependent neuroprotective protein a [Boleophthalmus pectinirostris]|uniref:activity-dependent neuroprotective protein a n=1 Tax=Boleophthalmus pectinirostris TaxID=150288 RepID=UPI000A1C612F|nr:activity-dependent neuroprotective protein a [Boleophthalmus pectinirostris]